MPPKAGVALRTRYPNNASDVSGAFVKAIGGGYTNSNRKRRYPDKDYYMASMAARQQKTKIISSVAYAGYTQ